MWWGGKDRPANAVQRGAGFGEESRACIASTPQLARILEVRLCLRLAKAVENFRVSDEVRGLQHMISRRTLCVTTEHSFEVSDDSLKFFRFTKNATLRTANLYTFLGGLVANLRTS